MVVESAVELLVVALALVAKWLSVRPYPELEWERLWKTILATCIRGQVERSGGDQAIWWERLKGFFSHAGRLACDGSADQPRTISAPHSRRAGARRTARGHR